MDQIDELKERRKLAYHRLIHSAALMRRARELYNSLGHRYESDRKEWEGLDRQLALIDGRLHIEDPAPSKHRIVKEVKATDLTLDQINRLLDEYGVNMEEPNDEEMRPM